MIHPFSDSECASSLNAVFSAAFGIRTVVNFTTPTSAYGFPTNSVVIDFDYIVTLIHYIILLSSCGIDNIHGKFLRNAASISSLFLTLTFQQSPETGLLPEYWFNVTAIQVHDSGNGNSTLNYGSVTCISCKFLGHIVYEHVLTYLKSYSIFSHLQRGFRISFSCESRSHLLTHVHLPQYLFVTPN